MLPCGGNFHSQKTCLSANFIETRQCRAAAKKDAQRWSISRINLRHVDMYMCVCVLSCFRACVWAMVNICIYVFIYRSIPIFVCMYVCVHASTYLHKHACIYVYIYPYTHKQTQTHSCILFTIVKEYAHTTIRKLHNILLVVENYTTYYSFLIWNNIFSCQQILKQLIS